MTHILVCECIVTVHVRHRHIKNKPTKCETVQLLVIHMYIFISRNFHCAFAPPKNKGMK